MNNPSGTIAVIDAATGHSFKLKNRLFEFGAIWLKNIDKKIASGHTPAAIWEWLKKEYKGSLPMPDVKTVRTYVNWRKEGMRREAKGTIRGTKEQHRTEQDLSTMSKTIGLANMDIGDRTELYERIVRYLLVRTETVANVQETMLDPRFESNITSHLALAKSTADSLLKMEGQLGIHGTIARLIIEKYMQELAPIIRQAAEDTYGTDKLRIFMERLSKNASRIDLARIKHEATAEVTATTTNEVLDAIQTIRPVAG